MGNLGFGSRTVAGPGFWLTFNSMILRIMASCTMCCSRRVDRLASATILRPAPRSAIPPKSSFRVGRAGSGCPDNGGLDHCYSMSFFFFLCRTA
ncbi:hypothetical protein V8E55_007870 [Tylopilus felleus]